MTEEQKSGYTRREILKMTAAAGSGLVIGASGLGTLAHFVDQLDPGEEASATAKKEKPMVPFYGKYQAGIITPQQTYAYIAAFDIDTDSRSRLIQLFKNWTKLSEWMTKGKRETGLANDWLPPKDTGEAQGLGPAHLTVTFGFGPTLFVKKGKDRFGLAVKKPKHLKKIPRMPRDDLNPEHSDGDVCVQVCADDQQVAFHALRNLINRAVGTATVKWMQEGFLSTSDGKTPRNLFGFKDGTANIKPTHQQTANRVIWSGSGEPSWMNNGTYMAFRKIRMYLDVWDHSSLKDQEDTFGRKKKSGAPYGKIHEHDPVELDKLPEDSHVRLAKSVDQEIYRRAYSYTDAIDPKTGNPRAGLLFISFQQNPDQSFIPMLRLLSKKDTLNEYIKHVASAMFACSGGVRQGEYIGQRLLDA